MRQERGSGPKGKGGGQVAESKQTKTKLKMEKEIKIIEARRVEKKSSNDGE